MSKLSEEQRVYFRLLTEVLFPWVWSPQGLAFELVSRGVYPRGEVPPIALRFGEAYVGDTMAKIDKWAEENFDNLASRIPSAHKRGGAHYKRLGLDLMLDIDGHYVRSGSHPVWLAIGEKWEGLDERAFWGGRLRSGDANHFGWRHGGVA